MSTQSLFAINYDIALGVVLKQGYLRLRVQVILFQSVSFLHLDFPMVYTKIHRFHKNCFTKTLFFARESETLWKRITCTIQTPSIKQNRYSKLLSRQFTCGFKYCFEPQIALSISKQGLATKKQWGDKFTNRAFLS